MPSGKFVDPLHLRQKDIDINDIAHNLGMQCRYSGAVRDFYSVGQHAVLVSRLLEAEGFDLQTQWDGLHHDDPEYLLQDMARPLKEHPVLGAAYREEEEKIYAVIAKVFGLSNPENPNVKIMDTRILLSERRCLLPRESFGKWSPGIEACIDPGIVIKSWTPRRAEREYLLRYEQLQARRDKEALAA